MAETMHQIKAAMDAGAHGWFNEWRGRRCRRRINALFAAYSRHQSVLEGGDLLGDRASDMDRSRQTTNSGRKSRLNPVVKAWLDRVLIPAMVERYIAKFLSGGDNQSLESVR